MAVYSVVEVMEGELPEGERIIVLGGGQSALMVADFLAEAGKSVVVLNRGRHFAEEMSSNDRFYLRERLNRQGVKLHKNVAVDAFLDRGARVRLDGAIEMLEDMDALVIAEGMTAIRPDRRLFAGRPIAVHTIGDAKEPRSLMLAIAEGEELGRSL
jgi:thioredoxin reductase